MAKKKKWVDYKAMKDKLEDAKEKIAELEENFEEVSKLVVKEAGKTIDEARGEVRRGIESVEFAFSVPSLMTGFKVEDISSGIDETAECQPLGVFAMLAPFNFPFLVPMWFLPVAIACFILEVIMPCRMAVDIEIFFLLALIRSS